MQRVLVFVLTALLSAASVAGSLAATGWEGKVDASVLDAARSGSADFIVYMSAHADLAPAERLATKGAKGFFVYDALTTTARESQAPLVARLADLGVEYRSFWIANSILVSTGSLDLLREIASRSDVQAVFGVGQGQLVEPVERNPTLAPQSADAAAAAGPSIAWVGADQAWALGYRGQGAVVANADTGVRWTHSALKAHYRGFDAATGTVDHDYNWHDAAGPNTACPEAAGAEPCDDDDHGTHTMGTMVGDDGGANQIGMAPDAQWIACKNMNQGFGVVPTYTDCMQWTIAPTRIDGSAADPSMAPDVVSNSWACVEVCAPPLLKDMVDATRAAGIVYVAAAGNNNQFTLGLTMLCDTIVEPPAVYHSTFTVGATNATNDNIASFSSLGPVNDNPIEGVRYRKPDISAPGAGIRSSIATNDTAYASFSGTSMASPHVAGLVALVISANPALRGHVDLIEQIIEETAVQRTTTRGCGGDSATDVPNNVFGYGRIDALAAVQKALVTQPPEPEPETNASGELVGLPAQIVDVQKETLTQQHPVTDYSTGTPRAGETTWRVVKDTGNCCENHLGLSPDGRLFDIGGSYVNYSDDRGQTWKSVRPLDPVVNGEGSLAMAPNGDVVAMTWDPYSGDRWISYKYNAATGEWKTLYNRVHHPFYDRPWLTVVPGPFTDPLGNEVPYISMVYGGPGPKDPPFISYDGLLYVEPDSTTLGGLTNEQVSRYFPISADASFDWIQPIRSAPITALGAGYAMFSSGYLFDPATREWSSWRLPGGSAPPSYIQIDSAGRIHNIRNTGGDSLEYRISSDGGQTWNRANFPLSFQADGGILTDFKVNRAAGVSAAAIRRNSQDWVYKFDISGNTARLLRVYRVGLGDNPSGSNVGALTSPRMDFQNVVIFPDGRVATSFLDSTTLSHPPGTGMLGRITPALAIEMDTTFDVGPTPTPTPTPTPATQADLTVTDMSASSQKPREGERVVISATITNRGTAAAPASSTEFRLDGSTVLGVVDTPALAAGASATVSVGWDTRGVKGEHTITAAADSGGQIAESNEANNVGRLTLTIRGNKVQNASFEEPDQSGNQPDAWQGNSTGAGNTSWSSDSSDGDRSVSITGTGGSVLLAGAPRWTSAPISVGAGEVLDFAVDVRSVGLSSAPSVSISWLNSAGSLLGVTQLAVPLSTDGFTSLSTELVVPGGVTNVRIVLGGFAPTDTKTAGNVTFDNVGLFAR
jgi:serine protease AprX